MSRADERIRRELHGLERPVRTDVFDRVAGRRRRRRTRHRVGVAVLAAAVVVGTLIGGYGLLRVFAPAERSRPGDGSSSGPTAQATPMCEVSSIDTLDVNGDGMRDVVEVYAEAPGPDIPCAAADPGPYHASVLITTAPGLGIAYTQDLPECEMPYACRVFAAPDVDDDGANEVAIQLSFGVSTTSFALYRFDLEASPATGPLVRLEVAEPGDPWDPEYGLPPGPATFGWYGSVTHLQWLSCNEDPEHRLAVMTALRSEEDPGRYLVHGTFLRLVGDELRFESSWDEEIREADLSVPETMCGAELIPAG